MTLTLLSEPLTSRLVASEDMEAPEAVPFASGTAVIYSARSPEKLATNEDAVAIIAFDDARGVLAIADGLGGHVHGERASQLALEHLRDEVAGMEDERDLRFAVLNAIEATNQELVAAGTGLATTLAIVEVDGNRVRPYHVGDSAILLFGQRGKIKMQTIAHSPVGYAVEAGLLDAQEAIHHEARHIISNIVGSPAMRIEIGPPSDMAMFDTLLLASDGLLDNLHVDEIVSIARKGPLTRVARELAAQAQSRMQSPKDGDPSKPDDLSLILYRRGRETFAS
jgi:serine/threonine protein phosphatase PrpC